MRWPQVVQVWNGKRWRWRFRMLDATFWRLAWTLNEDKIVETFGGSVLTVYPSDHPPQPGYVRCRSWFA